MKTGNMPYHRIDAMLLSFRGLQGRLALLPLPLPLATQVEVVPVFQQGEKAGKIEAEVVAAGYRDCFNTPFRVPFTGVRHA